jgi:hypothetical protein
VTPLGPRRDAEPTRLVVYVALAVTVATLGLSFALAASVRVTAAPMKRGAP